MKYQKTTIRPYIWDSINSYEDLMQRFVRDYRRANPKPHEFVLLSDKPEVLKAYNNMITRSYEPIEY
jgi:hypothetical protein